MVTLKEIDDDKKSTFSYKLKKLIPKSLRKGLPRVVGSLGHYTFGGAQVVGNLLWIVSTSFFVLLLPLRRAIEVEQQIIEQEQWQQQNGMYPMGGSPVMDTPGGLPQ